MDHDWLFEDDVLRWHHADHYEVERAVDGGVDADGWERYSVLEEQYHTLEADTIASLDSFHGATPFDRALSALRSLRPHRLHGLSAVSLALRYAKLRFSQGLSAGVRSIRRCLPSGVGTPLVRAIRRTSPPPARPVIPEWATQIAAANTLPDAVADTPGMPTLQEQCTACQVEISVRNDATRVPCGHLYHSACLLTLVEVAMRTPSQFPPRCCRRPIPTMLFRHLLNPVQHEAFTLLQAERASPRPLYCANPRCSRFLGERDKRTPVRIHTCSNPACHTRTCARCKAAVARDETAATHSCAYNAGHRAVLQLGTQHGWVRCPGCEQLVERNGGCPHMTCRCGTEFCYSCGRQYSGCVCGQRRTLYPVYAIPEPVFPAELMAEPARQRYRAPIPLFDGVLAIEDLEGSQRMQTTLLPWTEDERALEAEPPYHVTGVHTWPTRLEPLHLAIEEAPSWDDHLSEIQVPLPQSIAEAAPGSSEGRTPDDEQEETTPVSPAYSFATARDSILGRKGEFAQ